MNEWIIFDKLISFIIFAKKKKNKKKNKNKININGLKKIF